MLLYAKKSFKKMYPVAKNYFGGLLQAHSFSGYVPTFAFSDHLEIKGRSKPLTHPECRSTRSKHQREAAARQSSKVVKFCSCHAIPGGATNLHCRAIGSGATKGTCHAAK